MCLGRYLWATIVLQVRRIVYVLSVAHMEVIDLQRRWWIQIQSVGFQRFMNHYYFSQSSMPYTASG